MIRNYFLLNVLLFTVIILLGFKLYDAWTTTLDIPDIAGQQKVRVDKPERADVREDELSENAFDVITSKDPFSPLRSLSKKAPETARPVAPAEKPQLFGTMIMNNTEFAIFENPSTKKTNIYYLNDKIAGFVVSDIQEEKVVLLKDGESVEVRLRDDKKFKAPLPVRKLPSRVQSKPAARRRPVRRRAVRRAAGR
jgi:hypothetical protein